MANTTKPAHWGGAPTIESLRKVHRRQRTATTTQALNAMRQGAKLHVFYEQGRPQWRLSDGSNVAAAAVTAIINNPRVVVAGDSLFGDDGTSQTFRWIDQKEDRTS